MTDTKEQILYTALSLFAKDGFEAASVSAIAGELGMTKGALYKHYKNKRDILDAIVDRMYAVDTERARQHGVPEATFEVDPEDYSHTSVKNIKAFMMDQFVFWTKDDFGRDFRKLLTLEQYRDPSMADLYRMCLTTGSVSYAEDSIRETMKQGAWKQGDPQALALELYAPFYLLLSFADESGDSRKPLQLLEEHLDRFIMKYEAVTTQETND